MSTKDSVLWSSLTHTENGAYVCYPKILLRHDGKGGDGVGVHDGVGGGNGGGVGNGVGVVMVVVVVVMMVVLVVVMVVVLVMVVGWWCWWR